MSKNFDLKKEQVAEIAKKFEEAQSVVIVKYSGLTVEQATELRAQCRAAGVDYCVYKNTLVRRAVDSLNIEGLSEVLTGPNAFAFGLNDAVAPAKVLDGFITKSKTEAVKIECGLLGKEFMDAKKVKALADLPSREVLIARLLGTMTNTVAGFVRVLEAIRKQKAGEE